MLKLMKLHDSILILNPNYNMLKIWHKKKILVKYLCFLRQKIFIKKLNDAYNKDMNNKHKKQIKKDDLSKIIIEKEYISVQDQSVYPEYPIYIPIETNDITLMELEEHIQYKLLCQEKAKIYNDNLKVKDDYILTHILENGGSLKTIKTQILPGNIPKLIPPMTASKNNPIVITFQELGLNDNLNPIFTTGWKIIMRDNYSGTITIIKNSGTLQEKTIIIEGYRASWEYQLFNNRVTEFNLRKIPVYYIPNESLINPENHTEFAPIGGRLDGSHIQYKFNLEETIIVKDGSKRIGQTWNVIFMKHRRVINNVSIEITGGSSITGNAYFGSIIKESTLEQFMNLYEDIKYEIFSSLSLTSLLLPWTKSIGPKVFSYSRLTTLSLPNVITIGKGAFLSSRLSTVLMPKVMFIEALAFQESQLTHLSLPNVSTIGISAFQESRLNHLSLPMVTKIDDTAFIYSELTTLSLLKLTNIGHNTFAESKLTSLILPKVVEIGANAFGNIANERTTQILLPTQIKEDMEDLKNVFTKYNMFTKKYIENWDNLSMFQSKSDSTDELDLEELTEPLNSIYQGSDEEE